MLVGKVSRLAALVVVAGALTAGAGAAGAAPVVQCQAIGCEPTTLPAPESHNPNAEAPGTDMRPNGTDGNCGKYACQWK